MGAQITFFFVFALQYFNIKEEEEEEWITGAHTHVHTHTLRPWTIETTNGEYHAVDL